MPRRKRTGPRSASPIQGGNFREELLLLSSCHQPVPPLAISGPTMGTTYQVKVSRLRESMTVDALQAGVEERLSRVNRLIE